jgi:hypothetical protein
MVGLAGTVTISKQLIVAALPRAALLGRRGWLRCRRTLAALRLFARGGLRYASSAPRLYVAAGEQRQLLRADLALRTAADVANTLGAMKGVMMKLGQMASYVDDGLAPGVRRTLARLQDSVPPMRQELAAAVVEEELGTPPERAFARWDPQPIAAASIGQVHRALTLDGRAVAVKVQYPGIAQMMAADLRNVGLLRRIVRITAPAQDVDTLLTELSDRVLEELDYRREALASRPSRPTTAGIRRSTFRGLSASCLPAGLSRAARSLSTSASPSPTSSSSASTWACSHCSASWPPQRTGEPSPRRSGPSRRDQRPLPWARPRQHGGTGAGRSRRSWAQASALVPGQRRRTRQERSPERESATSRVSR